MQLLSRYRLLLIVFGLGVGGAAWELSRVEPAKPVPEEALQLPEEAETIMAFFPDTAEAQYYAAQKALFLRFDLDEARAHLERALATGVTTDERIFYSYISVLVRMKADAAELDAAVKAWRRHFPHSTARDPREVFAEESFPVWMQAGSRRPVALAHGRPLFAAMNEDLAVIELTDLITRRVREIPLDDVDVRFLFEFDWSGSTLGTAGDDDAVVLWDVETGAPRATLTGHQRPVESLAFSHDDQQLATGSRDHTIKLWSASDGAEVATLAGHTSPVSAIAFSPDGRLLASGSWSGELRIWDVQERRTRYSKQAHDAVVTTLAFSPAGGTLASSGRDDLVKLWDVEKAAEQGTLRGHLAPVYGVTFSRSGRTLASCSGDRTVRLWSAANQELVDTSPEYPDSAFAVDFLPDGRTIMVVCFDNSIHLWQPDPSRPRGG